MVAAPAGRTAPPRRPAPGPGRPASPPRRFYRASDGRLIAGVASGLAEHLGLSPLVVRVAFALLVAAGAAGILLYAGFWAVVPQRPPYPRDLAGQRPAGSRGDAGQLVALAALALGGFLLVQTLGLGAGVVVWPLVLGGIGVALLWRQADETQRSRWLAEANRSPWRGVSAVAATRSAAIVRTLVGGGLVLAGMAGYLAANNELRQAREGLLAIAVVVGGLALISGPWWFRLVGDLTTERRARIREQERAEVAAHVHDSVLQTLALIQKSADDPREVARLARGQERELRAWLYRANPSGQPDCLGPGRLGSGRLGAALEAAAAEVEEQYGTPIEVVVVGDHLVDERLSGLLQAAREAMVNAARHSRARSVAVYAEVEPHRVTVFVRDRGAGFDPDAVSADRLGIRESIVGRMARHGGLARLQTQRGEGTEIALELPLAPPGGAP